MKFSNQLKNESLPLRERSFVMSDGVTLVGDVGGPSGVPTVIFLHGGGQTRHSWAGATQALFSEGYAVINFDARGHGDSGWSPDGDYSMRRRGLDLAAVVAEIDGPYALVGASMGGVTALHALGDGLEPTPEAVIFVDIVPHPDAKGIARIRDFMTAHLDGFGSLDEASDAVAAYNPHRSRPSSLEGLTRNLRKRADGRLYWHWDPKILLPESHSDLTGEALARCCEAVTMPAALVRGLASDVVTDASVDSFQTMVEGLEVIDVAEAGHMVAGDENDLFVEGLQRFLKQHMSAG